MAVMSPINDRHNSEISTMKDNLAELKDDVRDVKNYLLYKKRPDENKGNEK
jgi:hypothetical protein